MSNLQILLGRILLAAIFILAGINKITGFEGTQGYMEAFGIPGILLPAVIALELGAGLALLVGFQTRLAAYALAAFSIISAVIFHANFGDQTQMIMFLKNLAIAGGLIVLAQHGAGKQSIDYKRQGKLQRVFNS